MNDKIYDTIIVGGGMAGLTAAIYASRKRMKYEMIAGEFGGQFMESGEILNYPGIVKTTGIDLNTTMEEQMKFNNVKPISEWVKSVEVKTDAPRTYIIKTDKNEYITKTAIITTGARHRKLGVPGEEELARKGVIYCSICDGPLFSGMDVAVVGGGNSALEAVDFMKDIARKIYVIVKGDKFTAHEYLIEKAEKNEKVEIIYGADTKEIIGDKFVKGLKYSVNGEEKEVKLQGIIVEIGMVPNTDLFKEFVALDKHGHIIIDCQTKTSQPGVFAAGDCASGHEYQYIIAAGQGCMALIKAARYLASWMG